MAKKPVIDLSAAIGAEMAEPEEPQARPRPVPVPVPAREPATPREPAARRGSRRRVQEPEPARWDARMSLTLSKEMKRDLDVARADDGVEGTARIRAMITLWQEDERLRRRIDKLAKTLR
jgi:hypothetical protein